MKWLHRLLNPHCPKCLDEFVEQKVCKSCEVLQYEVERLRADNDKLLSRILEKPAPEPTPEARVETPIKPRALPWAVRRQMLEAEDRQKARLLAQAAVENKQSTAELEKELDIAATAREAESSNSTQS